MKSQWNQFVSHLQLSCGFGAELRSIVLIAEKHIWPLRCWKSSRIRPFLPRRCCGSIIWCLSRLKHPLSPECQAAYRWHLSPCVLQQKPPWKSILLGSREEAPPQWNLPSDNCKINLFTVSFIFAFKPAGQPTLTWQERLRLTGHLTWLNVLFLLLKPRLKKIK